MVNATVAIKSNQIGVHAVFFSQHNSIETQSILGTIQGFHLFVMLAVKIFNFHQKILKILIYIPVLKYFFNNMKKENIQMLQTSHKTVFQCLDHSFQSLYVTYISSWHAIQEINHYKSIYIVVTSAAINHYKPVGPRSINVCIQVSYNAVIFHPKIANCPSRHCKRNNMCYIKQQN